MSIAKNPAWPDFISQFNSIARHHHRYEVFRDFVTMAAISIHNAIRMDDALEQEYLQIVRRYEKADVDGFCRLLAQLVVLLDSEPADVLGKLYMSLDLGSEHNGQYFTPDCISEMMARMMGWGELVNLENKPFVTVSEPACGAGGMVLALVKVMLDKGHDPAKKMWVHCQDIDRLAALMCYLQLSLWNVPAVVVVGNTLTDEVREVFYTPQHYLGFWEVKLRRQEEPSSGAEYAQQGQSPEVPAPAPVPAQQKTSEPDLPDGVKSCPTRQLDFGF